MYCSQHSTNGVQRAISIFKQENLLIVIIWRLSKRSLQKYLSTGDPISPEPQWVQVPRLLGGVLTVRGYPLAMVHAEKIVTALSRGTANSRWRDFADIYLLSRHHQVDGTEMVTSLRDVASHRSTRLTALGTILDGYGEMSQSRWVAWRKKQMLEDRLPESFAKVIADVIDFAEPAIDGSATGLTWSPAERLWHS